MGRTPAEGAAKAAVLLPGSSRAPRWCRMVLPYCSSSTPAGLQQGEPAPTGEMSACFTQEAENKLIHVLEMPLCLQGLQRCLGWAAQETHLHGRNVFGHLKLLSPRTQGCWRG